MNSKPVCFWAIVFFLPLVPHALLADTEGVPLASIKLEKQVYFMSPDEEDLVVPPGYYTVEAASDGLQLIGGLTPEQAGEAFLLQVRTRPSGEQVEEPRAVSTAIGKDAHYLALLLPTGQILESFGSYSGVRSRGENVGEMIMKYAREVEKKLANFKDKEHWRQFEKDLLEGWKEDCSNLHPKHPNNHNSCCIKKNNLCLKVAKGRYSGSARQGYQNSCREKNRACWVRLKGEFDENWMLNYCESKKNLKKLRTRSQETCCKKMYKRCLRAAYSVPKGRREISVNNCKTAEVYCDRIF